MRAGLNTFQLESIRIKQENPIKKDQKRLEISSEFLSKKTRPDTWQDSCGRLGRSSKAKTARNSKMGRMDGRMVGRTYQPTRQGVESA